MSCSTIWTIGFFDDTRPHRTCRIFMNLAQLCMRSTRTQPLDQNQSHMRWTCSRIGPLLDFDSAGSYPEMYVLLSQALFKGDRR
jgi:hypothetical protein